MRRCQHVNPAFIIGDDVFGAGLERGFHHGVFVGAGRVEQLATVLEHERHRTLSSHIAAKLGERVAHFSDGADAVICHAVDNDRRAINAVTLVTDFFIVDAIQGARTALNRTGDIVLGHVGIGCLVDGQAQTRISVRFAATHPGCNGDFLDQARPDLAALFVLTALAMLNIGPFGMSGHKFPFK